MKSRRSLNAGVHRINAIGDIEAKVIKAQTNVEVKPLPQNIKALLRVARYVGHVGVGAGGRFENVPFFCVKQADIDLIVVKIRADREQRSVSEKLVRMQVLRIETLLQPGIVLLNFISVNGIM